MKKYKCNLMIYSSSACVYGANPACTEEDKLVPTNPYG